MYIVGSYSDNEAGGPQMANEDPLLNFLHHIDQGALDGYAGIRYINNKATDNNGRQ